MAGKRICDVCGECGEKLLGLPYVNSWGLRKPPEAKC